MTIRQQQQQETKSIANKQKVSQTKSLTENNLDNGKSLPSYDLLEPWCDSFFFFFFWAII